METYKNLYSHLCSYENLELAINKARKKKTLKDYVIIFEANREENLKQLKYELENLIYFPRPMTTFIVRDPKTRKINASDFRDRVVHHALYNVISPIFEKDFIFDSFANRKGKGNHLAIKRFEKFLRQVSFNHQKPKCGGGATGNLGNNEVIAYALKADIKHYFDTVDHEILLNIIKRKVKDIRVIWLIEIILKNHRTRIHGKGMPLGNFTSQFFANLYLHELDLFVKHKIKAEFYIRYVDDCIFLHKDRKILEMWRYEIDTFLKNNLKIELHPEKSRIIPLRRGLTFLGFRIFAKYRMLKKSNARRIWKRLEKFKRIYDKGEISREEIVQSLEGWLAYAEFANTYNFRIKVVSRFNNLFSKLANYSKKNHYF